MAVFRKLSDSVPGLGVSRTLALCAFTLAAAAVLAAPAIAAEAPTADSVKQEFRHAWDGYVQYAWGHDALKPLSLSYRDWYGPSLLMTPVDALDTMILMGLTEEAAKTRELIATRLDFNQDVSVSGFEITIRLLGGLLSSYQLTNDPRLLALARDLGDRLLPAFDSPTGMPYGRINLRTGAKSHPVSNPAEIGTLTLEFGTLSKLTGNPVYYDRAKKAVTALYSRASPLGLVGTEIDVETGEWKNFDSHVGSRIDSYYEYLYKAWRLFGDADFLAMWRRSIESANRYLADDTGGALWYGHADMRTGARTASAYGALDAFLPALLALSGDGERARRLQDSGLRMWNLYGIEPEQLDYRTMTVLEPGYPLRPEIIESAYYLLRTTGEEKYRDMGRTFFDGLVKHCRTDAGYAALSDVRTGAREDSMESFFFAETLKYAYLIFAPAGTLDLGEVVLNTEAHPLRRTW